MKPHARRQRALDDTAVLVIGDNGYFYGEHGLSEERRLAYEESIRLPLLLRYPPRVKAGTRPAAMALTTDLAPTLLELAGAPALPGIDGRSLVPLFTHTPADWRKSFLIEYTSDIVFPRMLKMGYDAVRTERYKFIRYRELDGMDELYDLAADPFELTGVPPGVAPLPIKLPGDIDLQPIADDKTLNGMLESGEIDVLISARAPKATTMTSLAVSENQPPPRSSRTRAFAASFASARRATGASSALPASSAVSIAPMLAPLIGGQVLWFLGWRAIFWVLAGIGVIAWLAAYLRLPETLRPEYRQPLHLGSVVSRFGELLKHRAFMGYALTGTFQFSALMSFLSGSPFVFIQTYGIDPRAFGLIFGGQVMFLTMGSLLNAKFAPVFGAGRILYWGVCVPLVAGPSALILGLIEVRTGAIGLWPFLACFIAQIASISMIGANSMALALQRYPHMAGTASSLMGVLQFGIGALFGIVVGQTFDGTILPMVLAMGISGLLCFVSNRVLVGREY
mgnify:CR=1 FL=1